MSRTTSSKGSLTRTGGLIEAALRGRGFSEVSTTVPERGMWRWAACQGCVGDRLPDRVAELVDLDAEQFAYVVQRDALVEPNPYLADDALLERWAISRSRAVRDARADVVRLEARLATRPEFRTPAMRARLRAVQEKLNLPLSRKEVVRQFVANFRVRLVAYVGELTAEACRTCAAEVRDRLIHEYRGSSGDAEGRLVVATDASGRGGEACGYGWIAETGQAGDGLTVTTDPHLVEMIAICRAAVAPELADRELLILSDNRSCVDLINRVLRNGVSKVQRRRRHPLPWMRQAYAQRHRAKVAWIKAHSDHILNDAADRLAALAISEGQGVAPAVIADELSAIRGRIAPPHPLALLRAA